MVSRQSLFLPVVHHLALPPAKLPNRVDHVQLPALVPQIAKIFSQGEQCLHPLFEDRCLPSLRKQHRDLVPLVDGDRYSPHPSSGLLVD